MQLVGSGTVYAKNRASAQLRIFRSATRPYLSQPADLFTRSLTMVRDGRGLIAMTGEVCRFDSTDDADDDHGRVYFSFEGSKTCQVCPLPLKK